MRCVGVVLVSGSADQILLESHVSPARHPRLCLRQCASARRKASKSGAGAGWGSISAHHAPSKTPKQRHRHPDQPLRAKSSEDAQHRHQGQRDKHHAGAQPQDARVRRLPAQTAMRREIAASPRLLTRARRHQGPGWRSQIASRSKIGKDLWRSSLSGAAELNHCFQMKRLRKQVGKRQGFDRISHCKQRAQVARQRCRIAGDVDQSQAPQSAPAWR